ncbi:MAG TPA: Gfo/Idh/MocA family oxidoreductase [Bryobacteraceae bacterium]
MSALRAGVIGCGYMGQLHLRAYEDRGVRVTAIADTRPSVMETAPAQVRRFENYRDLLREDIDVVSICLPTNLHLPVTVEALAAAKHVLLEKPIAASVDDAERMIAFAHAARRRLFVGMTHRFYPEVLAAKALVDSGAIGDIVLIRDSILEYFGLVNAPPWFLEKQSAGGGTVLSSGIHLVDRVLWFLGEQPASVSGSRSNFMFGQELEDAAQMSLEFASGRSAQITFALLPEPHPLVCDLEVIGTRGSIVVRTWRGYELRACGRVERHDIYRAEPHPQKVLVGLRAEVDEFCAAIREGRVPRPSAEESTRALAVVESFYRAAKLETARKRAAEPGRAV